MNPSYIKCILLLFSAATQKLYAAATEKEIKAVASRYFANAKWQGGKEN